MQIEKYASRKITYAEANEFLRDSDRKDHSLIYEIHDRNLGTHSIGYVKSENRNVEQVTKEFLHKTILPAEDGEIIVYQHKKNKNGATVYAFSPLELLRKI